MITINIGLKDYVKSGETVFLTNTKGQDLGHGTAQVQGWGKMAPVVVGGFTIRRDGIVKNDQGDWTYTFRD